MHEIILDRYYNRFGSNPQYKDYKELLFRSSDILQSAEVNEIETTLKESISSFTNSFIRNGEFISGGELSITKVPQLDGNGDPVLGENNLPVYDFTILCSGGVLFFENDFFEIEAKTYTKSGIISDIDYIVGVKVDYSIIEATDDPSLLEPANNIRNFGQPGAARLKITGEWAFNDEITEGDLFIKTHEIKDAVVSVGEIIEDEFRNKVVEVVGEYDRESRGNYVVKGYDVSYIEKDTYLGDFHFQLSEGKADIYGKKFSRDYTSELTVSQLVDFELHQGEPIVFNGSGYYEANHAPVRKVFRISGEKNIINNITHGQYLGASDSLPSQFTPVVRIKSVYQGGVTYQSGVDFYQDGDQINWSKNGAEPAPNSTYTVEWDYVDTQVYGSFEGDNGKIISDISKNSIYLDDYNIGSVVSVDYDFVLNRKDIISMDSNGDIVNVKGVPREYNPLAPNLPSDYISLAEVELSGDKDPYVYPTAQRVYKFSDIEDLYDMTVSEQYNISKLATKMNLKEREDILRNSFIDIFEDDSQRDAGLESASGYKKALIASGDLTLNIDFETLPVDINESAYSVLEPKNSSSLRLGTNVSNFKIIDQPHYTKFRKITENFYANPPAARLRVHPELYSWIDRSQFIRHVNYFQASTQTRWLWSSRNSSSTVRQELSRKSKSHVEIFNGRPAIIPNINIRLFSEEQDFNSNEEVDVFWNGSLLQTINADSNGKIDLGFNVPNNEVSGVKRLVAVGKTSGVNGQTFFFARPLTRVVTTITDITWRWFRTIRRVPPPPPPPPPRPRPPVLRNWWRRDPIAQSFSYDQTFVLDKLKVWFETAPTSDAFVEIVELEAGYPSSEKILTRENFRAGTVTSGALLVDFTEKVTIEAGKTYAFVVGCEDPNASLHVAKLGERTIDSGEWLTGQSYSTGVMFNSSNNETWTAIQDEDLRFEIYSTTYEQEKTVQFTPVSVSNITDLMFSISSEVAPETSLSFTLVLPDATPEIRIENVVPFVQYVLDETYSGNVILETTLKSENGVFSPILAVNAEIYAGKVDTQCTYTSVGFDFDPSDKKTVVYLERISGEHAGYTVELQIQQGTNMVWVPMTLEESSIIDDGWYEDKFTLDITSQNPNPSQNLSRVRINLSTTLEKDRIVLQNLRLNNINL